MEGGVCMKRNFLFKFSIHDKKMMLNKRKNSPSSRTHITDLKKDTSFFIPSTNEISKYHYSGNEQISKIKFPETIKHIGEHAFSKCSNLEHIDLPKGLEVIGDYAFSECKKLKSVHIPDGVKIIGSGAFYGCENLSQINIPDSVITVRGNPFIGTAFLKQHSSFPLYVNNHLIKYADTFDESNSIVTIRPGTKTIAGGSINFMRNLKKINFPEGLLGIGNLAICGCDNLKTIDLPDSLTCIYGDSFRYLENLQSINVGRNNKAFKTIDGVLYNKDMTEIILVPEGLKSGKFVVPHGVKKIGKNSFDYCKNIQTIILPETLTEIGEEAFGACARLEKVIIPKSVTTIGKFAFSCCNNLKTVRIPNTVSKFGLSPFLSCEKLTIECEKDSPIAKYAISENIKHRFV